MVGPLSGFDRGQDNLNNIILTVDGTHIPISKPCSNTFDYMNRHEYFSINVIAFIDYNQDLGDLRWNVESHDSRILRYSNLMIKIEEFERYGKIATDYTFRVFESRTVPSENDPSCGNYELKTQRVRAGNSFALFKNKFKRFKSTVIRGERSKNIKILLSSFRLDNFIVGNS